MINEANILKRINNLDQLRTGDTIFVKLHDVYDIIFDEMKYNVNNLRDLTTITCQAPDVTIKDCVKSISQT